MRQLNRKFGELNARFILSSGVYAVSATPYDQLLMLVVYRMNRAHFHYEEARACVLAQIEEAKRWENASAGGQALPILGFSSAFDELLADMYLIDRSIKRMGGQAHPSLAAFAKEHSKTLTTVSDMRNDSQHMDQRIADGVLNGGPVQPAITVDGNYALLGSNEAAFADVADCIEGVFDAIQQLVC